MKTSVFFHQKLVSQSIALLAGSIFCVALLAVRWYWWHSPTYWFMVWNLFLAWIPYCLSVVVRGLRIPILCWGYVWLWLAWLLFFPNAPYLITDLIHLQKRPYIPLWFDTLMLFAFAWQGICLSIASLQVWHQDIALRYGVVRGWYFVAIVLLLTGFGLYLGRFARFNTWDIIAAPIALLENLISLAAHPKSYNAKTAIGVTLGFAAFMGLVYWTAHQQGTRTHWQEQNA